MNPAILLDTLIPSNVSAKMIKKLGGPEYYERSFRFSPWELIKKLRENESYVQLVMFGYPLIGKPWIYYHSNACIKPPMIYYPQIVFDKITNLKLLRKFEEIIVAIAQK